MAETTTPNFKWTKPDISGDAATWGPLSQYDHRRHRISVVSREPAKAVPIGSMTMWAGPTTSPPAGGSSATVRRSIQPRQNTGAIQRHRTGVQHRADRNAICAAEPDPEVSDWRRPQRAWRGGRHVQLHTRDRESAAAQSSGFARRAQSLPLRPGVSAHGIAAGGHSHAIHTGGHSRGLGHGVLTPNAGGNARRRRRGLRIQHCKLTGAVGDLGGSTDAAGNLGRGTPTPRGTLAGARGTRTSHGAPLAVLVSATPLSIVPPFIAINFIIRAF